MKIPGWSLSGTFEDDDSERPTLFEEGKDRARREGVMQEFTKGQEVELEETMIVWADGDVDPDDDRRGRILCIEQSTHGHKLAIIRTDGGELVSSDTEYLRPVRRTVQEIVRDMDVTLIPHCCSTPDCRCAIREGIRIYALEHHGVVLE